MTDKNIEIEGENEELESSQNTPNEPVISPKDNDELLIEFEEKAPIISSEKPVEIINQEISPEINDELSKEINDELIEPTEIKKEIPIRPEQKRPIPKKHAPQKIKEPKDPNTKSSKKGLVFAILILVIFGAAAYLFVLNPKILADRFPILVEKGLLKVPGAKIENKIEINKTEATPSVTEEQANETTPQKEVSEEKVVEKIIKELEEPKATPPSVKTTKAPDNIIKINNTGSDERIVQKGKLQTPCWIIGYASVTKEAVAIKTVTQISGKKCGYYWIPDYFSNGPKMYKVYVGPFNTKAAAQAELPSVKTEVPAAYVIEVK